MKPENQVEELVNNLANIYVDGEELDTDENLSKPGWRFYESHTELVRKIRNLHDIDTDNEAARRAMTVGLQILSGAFVRPEFGEHLKDVQSGENNQ